MSFKIFRVNHFHITIYLSYKCWWTSQVAEMVKNLPAMQETWVHSLGMEGSLEKGMATHSSIIAWRIPRTEFLAGYSPWNQKELDIPEQHYILYN